MSVIARTGLRVITASSSLKRVSPIAVRYVGGHGSTSHDNDPEVLEAEKQKNLSGTQTKSTIHNAPGWNEKLSSASEAVIKADRANVSPEELQSITVEAIQLQHSPEERASAREAAYKSDDVLGPLSSAKSGKTTTTTVEEKVTKTTSQP